jgi:hypothetical protein
VHQQRIGFQLSLELKQRAGLDRTRAMRNRLFEAIAVWVFKRSYSYHNLRDERKENLDRDDRIFQDSPNLSKNL